MIEKQSENERVARLVPEDIVTEGVMEVIDEVYLEDAIEHAPFGRDLHGKREIKASMIGYRAAFPDLTATVEDVVAHGDTVAMRVTLRGTHRGEFMGQNATHNSFEIQSMTFTRIEKGRIAERWVQPDTLGMLQQIGAGPEELVEDPVSADD